MQTLSRNDYVLAVLAASDGHALTPVQVQKLFFLLDRKIADRIGGPRFNFSAYDYGPFDSSVYSELENLSSQNLAEIDKPQWGLKQFRATPQGLQRGTELLKSAPDELSKYIRDLVAWVRGLSFTDLVSTIYKEYPDMKANSIFRG